MDIEQLLHVRGESYKDAWLKTSRWIQEHRDILEDLGDMVFPVIMIVNKLHRMEADPKHPDNIFDIAGYAELAVSVPRKGVVSRNNDDTASTINLGGVAIKPK